MHEHGNTAKEVSVTPCMPFERSSEAQGKLCHAQALLARASHAQRNSFLIYSYPAALM